MKLFGRKKARKADLQFDPETQYAVIRSSICTGEKVAGFKNKTNGHFTEVMLIRPPADEKKSKKPTEWILLKLNTKLALLFYSSL